MLCTYQPRPLALLQSPEATRSILEGMPQALTPPRTQLESSYLRVHLFFGYGAGGVTRFAFAYLAELGRFACCVPECLKEEHGLTIGSMSVCFD